MNMPYVSATYPSKAEAEAIALQLVERGIPEPSITLTESPEEFVEGLSLGAGVTPAATEALVEAHEGGSPYMVTVNTAGNISQEEVVHEVFRRRS